MRQQVELEFDTREEAVAYAEKNGIPYQVFEPHGARRAAQILCGQFPLRPQGAVDRIEAGVWNWR